MTKFKNNKGGVCEVFTELNINRLRNNPDYTEIIEGEKPKKNKKVEKPIEEVVEIEPLQ